MAPKFSYLHLIAERAAASMLGQLFIEILKGINLWQYCVALLAGVFIAVRSVVDGLPISVGFVLMLAALVLILLAFHYGTLAWARMFGGGVRLAIDFGPEPPWVAPLMGNVPLKEDTFIAGSSIVTARRLGTPRKRCIFIRFEARVLSGGTAKGCSAWLTGIEKREENAWRPTAFGSSLRLRWVDAQNYEPHDVHEGVRALIDLFSTDVEWNTIKVKWEKSFIDNEGIFEKDGAYKFSVSVVSETGCKASDEFILNWRGQWDDLDVGKADGKIGKITWPVANT